MEFWTSVHVILRRWYVVVACAVVFALLALGVAHEIKPSYQTSGKAFVVTPNTTNVTNSANASNPFGSAGQFANVLATSAGDQAFADQVAKAGGPGRFTVDQSVGNTSLLLITATASSPAGALATYRAVTDALDQKIVQLQKRVGVDPDSITYYGSITPDPASQPTTLVGSRIKALILLAVIALVVTLGLVFLTDSWLAARERRREDDEQAAPAPTQLSVAEDIISLDEFTDPDLGLRGADTERSFRSPPSHEEERGAEAAGS